jgi:hypothetical protein
MGENGEIRVLSPDEVTGVSDTYKQKMKDMGMMPYVKKGKIKWGNMAQIAFLQSLKTADGKKLMKKADVSSLPPSMRKRKGKMRKLLKKISAQYVILIICFVIFGVVLLYMKFM